MINHARCASFLFAGLVSARTQPVDNATSPCRWIDDHAPCPDADIRFYLFTRDNTVESQLIHIDDSWESSNLSSSSFNPLHATKIIIHGFRADMFLAPLFDMKTGEYPRLLSSSKFIPDVKIFSLRCSLNKL
jgi:Lipase